MPAGLPHAPQHRSRWWFPRPELALDDITWEARHRALRRLATVQGLALLVASPAAGFGGPHLLLHAGPLVLSLVAALVATGPRWSRSALVALTLFGESALLVHLGDGEPALHFHFFVMLVLLGLYEDARPLVVGIAFVLLHHALLGLAEPTSVLGDGSESDHVVAWAAVHGLFILAASAGLVVLRRASEAQRSRLEATLGREQATLAHLRDLAHRVATDPDPCAAAVDGIAALLDGAELVALGREDPVTGAVTVVAATGATAPGTVLDAAAVTTEPVDGDVVLAVRRSAPGACDDREASLAALGAVEAAVAWQRAAETRRLEEEARTDVLTGCANRRRWKAELTAALAGAEGAPLTVVVLDLNDFKGLNDREGHEAGDRCLRLAARAWSGVLPDDALLARLGGDEFAVLLPGARLTEGVAVAARLSAATPTASGAAAGAAEWDGREDGEALVRRADEAMYADKRRTRGQRLSTPERVEAARHALARADRAQLDELAESVRRLLGVPTSLISLITDDAHVVPGMAPATGSPVARTREIALEHSICAQTITAGRPLVIEDAAADPLIRDHVAVQAGLVGAYAGVPFVAGGDQVVGVLCAVDAHARRWSEDELASLRHAARRAGAVLGGVPSPTAPAR